MLNNLRKLRLEKGMSQQKLAEMTGVTQQAVNKYENHNVQPDLSVLIKMADIFETSVDHLIGNTDIRRRIENTEPYSLNADEANLIDSYRRLTDRQRESIKSITAAFLEPLDKN